MNSHREWTLTHWGAYQAEIAGGRLVGLSPDPDDPSPSRIGRDLHRVLDSDSRVRRPAVRRSFLKGDRGHNKRRGQESFSEVSWDDAYHLVAEELVRVRENYGNEAIFGGSYGWGSAGRFHHAQSQIHRFLNCFGGYTRSVNTYSSAAGEVIVKHVLGLDIYELVYGGIQHTWDEILDETELLISFGGMPLKNTQVGSGGPMLHRVPGVMERLRSAGVEMVYIGPIEDDLGHSTEVIQPRPGSDVAIMLSMAYTLFDEGLADTDLMDGITVGWELWRAYVLGHSDGVPKTPEWAENLSTVPAEKIRRLARRGRANKSLITGSLSLQRQDHGEYVWWTLIALACLMGGVGKPGEGFGLGYGALNPVGNSGPRRAWPALPQGENPITTFIPVARIADALLSPGSPFNYNGRQYKFPDLRLIYWAGGNPFHHHQDLNKLRLAWTRPEAVIVHETHWTATAQHADIVLPACSSFERNDIGCSSLESTVISMAQVKHPLGESASDFEILTALAARLGIRDVFTAGRDETGWLEWLYSEIRTGLEGEAAGLPNFEEFRRLGKISIDSPNPVVREPFLAGLRADPIRNPLRTESGRIEIFSRTIANMKYDDCPPMPTWNVPREWLGSKLASSYPFHLISNQPATRLHSQYGDSPASLESKVNGHEPILVNVADAKQLGIENGDVLRVFNDRGSCLAGAVLSDRIRRSVLQLSTGARFTPEDPARMLSIDLAGNPNVLTPDRGTCELSQGPSAHSTLVDIERCDAGLAPHMTGPGVEVTK